jgi:hypothetical protein
MSPEPLLGLSRPSGIWLTATACVCLLLAGCGKSDDIVQVQGTVLVNGERASGAQVIFHPVGDDAGIVASGVTGEDGAYRLMSGLEKGIRPGSYRVTVIWPDPDVRPTEQEIMMGTAEQGPDLLKGRYASRDKSELQVEISSDTTEIPPFELTKP